MTLDDLKTEVRKYVYMEDDTVIDASIACIIANRLNLGNPVWLVLIGASSGGKSQMLKPLALSDTKYMHTVDDVTENTFLSGAKIKDGDASLLHRIGSSGMLVISDLTVLFSKNSDQRNAILSQFRMLYDGEMVRRYGNQEQAVSWKGFLGIIAGSTPSIYRHFEEVADMGERFMYWRLKPYDEEKATRLALSRTLTGRALDEHLAEIYREYIEGVVRVARDNSHDNLITEDQKTHIIRLSLLAEKIRTSVNVDKYTKDIDRLPVPAFPMRTALQLTNVAKSLSIMRGAPLTDEDMGIVSWLAWSLGNEEKRACLTVLANAHESISAKFVAHTIGLSTTATKNVLQSLAAVGIVDRFGDDMGTLKWGIKDEYRVQVLPMCGSVAIIADDMAEEDDLAEIVAQSGF